MKEQLEKIADFVARNCSADDYTLNVYATDSHATRFAQNAITQHIAGENVNVYLETSFDGKTGSASVNQADEDGLKHLIQTAESIARLNQTDPEHVSSEAAKPLPATQGVADATNLLSPEKMVDIIQAVIANATSRDAAVSGMTEKHLSRHLTATRKGFYGFYDQSMFSHSMTMKRDAVETKVSYSTRDFAKFKLIEQIGKLNEQFESLGTPQNQEAERIPVILRPAAVMDLLGFLGWMMRRRQADEGLTAFTGQIGKQFFGEKFSMASLLDDPDLNATPFSHDGIASENTWWIKDGILSAMPTDRYWAQQIGVKPIRSMYNIFIPGGDSTEEDMMKLVPRGLIINRFWYIRFVDVKKAELTGMTRDGVLYFEDGKIRHAVNNLRFNEIPPDVTRRILSMGKSELCDETMKLPTMLVDGFNFVDKTTF